MQGRFFRSCQTTSLNEYISLPLSKSAKRKGRDRDSGVIHRPSARRSPAFGTWMASSSSPNEPVLVHHNLCCHPPSGLAPSDSRTEIARISFLSATSTLAALLIRLTRLVLLMYHAGTLYMGSVAVFFAEAFRSLGTNLGSQTLSELSPSNIKMVPHCARSIQFMRECYCNGDLGRKKALQAFLALK